MKPAEHERHCSLCEGQYIHDECDGLGLGPPDHAEHEQQPSSEAPINPACMQSFDGRDWASDFRATAKPAQDEPAPTKPTREDLKAVLEGMLRAAQDEPPCEGEYERGVRAERERCKWHACYCSWSGDVFEECEICSGAPMRRAAQDEHGGKATRVRSCRQ